MRQAVEEKRGSDWICTRLGELRHRLNGQLPKLAARLFLCAKLEKAISEPEEKK